MLLLISSDDLFTSPEKMVDLGIAIESQQYRPATQHFLSEADEEFQTAPNALSNRSAAPNQQTGYGAGNLYSLVLNPFVFVC